MISTKWDTRPQGIQKKTIRFVTHASLGRPSVPGVVPVAGRTTSIALSTLGKVWGYGDPQVRGDWDGMMEVEVDLLFLVEISNQLGSCMELLFKRLII